MGFHRTTIGADVFSFRDVANEKKLSRHPQAASARRSPPEVYLRAWRKKKRLSLEVVAEAIGSDKGTLSEIETRNDPDAARIRGRWAIAYAGALGLMPNDLLRHPNQGPSVGQIVEAAPAELQQHILGIVAHLSRVG